AGLLAPAAHAEDVVVLKDGTELRGEIQNEHDGWIWLKRLIGGIEKVEVISPDRVESVQRDAEEVPADQLPGSPGSQDPRAAVRRAPADITVNRGTVRGTVVTLEGTVGIQMTAKALRDIIPVLEQEIGADGSGVLVLKINSGGGL